VAFHCSRICPGCSPTLAAQELLLSGRTRPSIRRAMIYNEREARISIEMAAAIAGQAACASAPCSPDAMFCPALGHDGASGRSAGGG
jgi:hypothetical protein